jgi:hypothetical protein
LGVERQIRSNYSAEYAMQPSSPPNMPNHIGYLYFHNEYSTSLPYISTTFLLQSPVENNMRNQGEEGLTLSRS